MPRKRKTDTPTRSEVTERVEKNNDEMEEKVEELDTIATDTETVRETLDALDFEGTADAANEVEDIFEQTENITIEKFNEEDELKKEAEKVNLEFEGYVKDNKEIDKLERELFAIKEKLKDVN